MAGGKCKYVPLELEDSSGKWVLDMNKLENAIGTKTKIVLINTPHNPTGKVFSKNELEQIAAISKRNPHVTFVTDEVYEKLVYDDHEHICLASLPDMWDQCLTISSCGKTFSATGWKVGWVIGSSHLINPIVLANQWIHFCVSTPNQKAIAKILEESDKPYHGYENYYSYIREQYRLKRDHLVESLRLANINPSIPEGGFFIMANTSNHPVPEKYFKEPGPDGNPVSNDWAFARFLFFLKSINGNFFYYFYCLNFNLYYKGG